MTPLDELRLHLSRIAPGGVIDKRELAELLVMAWAGLGGSATRDHEIMGGKLPGRMEDVEWNPPVLSFRIERHGGIVSGGTRAEMQTWHVNIDAGTAEGGQSGFRQLYPMDRRPRVEPLVDQVVALIKNHQTHDWVKWVSDVRVRVLIAKFIPTTNKQTTTGRRNRFRAALEPRLVTMGYRQPPGAAPNTYERTP